MVIKLIFPCENKSYLSKSPCVGVNWGMSGRCCQWSFLAGGSTRLRTPRLERQTCSVCILKRHTRIEWMLLPVKYSSAQVARQLLTFVRTYAVPNSFLTKGAVTLLSMPQSSHTTTHPNPRLCNMCIYI